jgi:hypothetical protein
MLATRDRDQPVRPKHDALGIGPGQTRVFGHQRPNLRLRGRRVLRQLARISLYDNWAERTIAAENPSDGPISRHPLETKNPHDRNRPVSGEVIRRRPNFIKRRHPRPRVVLSNRHNAPDNQPRSINRNPGLAA